MGFKLANLLPQMTEAEYRAEKCASYSALSRLSNNDFSIFDKEDTKFSKGLSLGSVVDKMIFEPDFNVYNEYNIVEYVPDFSGSTAIDQLLNHIKENGLEFNDTQLEELNTLSKDLNLWRGTKNDELRINNINTDNFWHGVNYLKLEKNNKPFLLSGDLMIAFKMVEVLKTYKYTKDIFNPSDKFEYIYQGKILFEANGMKMKSMLDIMIVDHVNKIIYPKDLKTGESRNFYQNFNRFHYPMQSSAYTLAIKSLINSTPELKEYKVGKFEFIYISRESINTPMIFEMHNLYTEMGITGWTSANGVRYKGIIELLDDYNWHLSKKIYDIARDVYYRNGRVRLGRPFDLSAYERLLRNQLVRGVPANEIPEVEDNDTDVDFEENEETTQELEF